jgi:hypothetical protein
MEEALDSSYLVISDGSDGVFAPKGSPRASRKRKHEQCEDEWSTSKFITILTPKKVERRVMLTPVKRSKRMVINKLRNGSIKRLSSQEALHLCAGEEKYLPLVECSSFLEKLMKIEKKPPRASIDTIVKKYLKEE